MTLIQHIKNNTANAVTAMNLVCGSLACIAAFHCFGPWWWGLQGYQVAFILIAAAAVFDFFDGFVARALHVSSALGGELDSLSDSVSFGLAPALVLYNMLAVAYPGCWLPYLALLLPVFGAIRLARFNVDANQTTTFTGLAIPANAIFWIGFCDFYATHHAWVPLWAVLALVVAMSLLMVCNLRMFSLKVHSRRLRDIYRQVLLIVAFVAFVLLGGLPGLACGIVFYVVLAACTREA